MINDDSSSNKTYNNNNNSNTNNNNNYNSYDNNNNKNIDNLLLGHMTLEILPTDLKSIIIVILPIFLGYSI